MSVQTSTITIQSMSTAQRPSSLGQANGSTVELLPMPPASVPPLLPKHSVINQQSSPHKLCATSNNIAEGSSTAPSHRSISKIRAITVISTLAGMSFLNTMGSGILIGALPRIAEEVNLEEGFLLWPASIYALAAGCLLLIFGAVADVVGTKLVWVTGSYLYVAFTLGVGFARTGTQIILFRAFLGVAISMCLPTAVSLITNTFPKGTWRNIAFASNGVGSPLGYSMGLILGGVFTDTIGWRWAFHMSAMINFCIATAAVWKLPTVYIPSEKKGIKRLVEDIDWIGAFLMSVAMGLLLYVLAVTTSSYRRLSDAPNIALLSLSFAMLLAFPAWMEFQVRRNKPAIIPNKLWRNAAFTTTCIAVFFCWASLNAMQYFATLVFQRVQGVSALQSSLRFLPHVIMGVTVNVVTGYLVAQVKVRTMAVVSALITMVAPPLMATLDINSSYWYEAFWAMLLSVVSPDVLFTVSNLVISNAYPPEVQSLAGGVFNEVSQFGNAVGLAVTAAIAASVTEHSGGSGADALMRGYRAAFWTIFGATTAVAIVCFFGLRKSGTVGKKDE